MCFSINVICSDYEWQFLSCAPLWVWISAATGIEPCDFLCVFLCILAGICQPHQRADAGARNAAGTWRRDCRTEGRAEQHTSECISSSTKETCSLCLISSNCSSILWSYPWKPKPRHRSLWKKQLSRAVRAISSFAHIEHHRRMKHTRTKNYPNQLVHRTKRSVLHTAPTQSHSVPTNTRGPYL